MNQAIAFVVGLIFGIGLCLSGMIYPGKVLGFLDLAGAWDPSLLLVMAGAVAIGALTFRLLHGRTASLLGNTIDLPTARNVDARLIGGSLIFGIGWGLAGICPGPGIVLLGFGSLKATIFVAAMVLGMLLFNLVDAWLRRNALASNRTGIALASARDG